MNYTEKKGDLFNESREGLHFAHCISSDYALGAGIAVPFNKVYNMRERLNKIGSHTFPDCIKIDNVFNLVTKDKCYQKPTYVNLQASLILMREQIKKENIKELAMPLIGCGIDGLAWEKVSEMIKTIFKDSDINITICFL